MLLQEKFSACVFTLAAAMLMSACSDSGSSANTAEIPNDGTPIEENTDIPENPNDETNPETPAAFMIDDSNLDGLLTVITQSARAEAAASMLDVANGIMSGSFDEQLQSEPSEPQASFRVTVDNFSCPEDGTLIRTTIDQNTAVTREADIVNCTIDGTTYTGSITEESSGEGTFVLSVDNFVAILPRMGQKSLTGSYTEATEISVVDAEFLETDAQGKIVQDLDYYGAERATRFEELEWVYASDTDDLPVLTAKTDVIFERASAGEEFTIGSINIATDSGQAIIINADNGDPASFSVVVTDGDVTTSFVRNWTDDNRYFIAYP